VADRTILSADDTNAQTGLLREQGLQMSNSMPDQMTVTFAMTADDYARYFAVRSRHASRWANFLAYAAALFAAIPVALMFRSIGARLSASGEGVYPRKAVWHASGLRVAPFFKVLSLIIAPPGYCE
jgi:hypothetical protein